MADISKIKLLGETYDIKDEVARNAILDIKSIDVINVLDYDVDNTGTTDCASIINTLILNNPLKTIYFPDGDYLLTQSIDIPRDYDKGVNLFLSQNARIFANSDIENLVQVGLTVIDENSLDYKVSLNKILFILGGKFDCNNITRTCIKYDNHRQDFRLLDTSLLNFVSYGFLAMETVSGNAFISNCLIFGNSSENISIGIEDNGYDNYYNLLTIHNCMTGVRLIGGGATLDNVHVTCMYSRTPSTAEFQRTIGFEIIGNYTNWLSNVYADTCYIGFKINSGKNYITNGTVGWYYTDELSNIYGIKIEDDTACVFLSNFNFDMPNSGLKNYCINAPVSDTYRSMINFNRLYFNNIKVNDISGTHRDDADLVYNLALNSNKNIMTVKDWFLSQNNISVGEYAPIAFIARNASGFYKFLINSSNECQAEVSIYYGDTGVSYDVNSISSDDTWKISLCNQINVNGRDYAYICLSRTVSGNVTPTIYLEGASGNAIFNASDNMFNVTDSKFINPTILFETNL